MNAEKKRWTVFALAMAVALALGFVAWKTTSVQADINPQQPVSLPQVAHGLVLGESLRTTLVNRCARPIGANVFVLDAEGAVVKEETLVVDPGRTDTSEVSFLATDLPGPVLLSAAPSRLLRTEVRLRLADVPCMFMTGAVVKDSDGSSATLEKLASNHNETLVRDTAPME